MLECRGSVGKYVGAWGEVRRHVGGVKKCGRVGVGGVGVEEVGVKRVGVRGS